MHYRLLAIIIMFFTVYFSNTPNLMVSSPSTWLNQTEYEDIPATAFLESDSRFFDSWSEEKGLNFYLHKISHVTFYALIALFLLIHSKSLLSVFFKLAFLFVFAISDEIHQYYVVGRSGRLIDSILDFSSVIVVFLLLVLFKKLIKKKDFN